MSYNPFPAGSRAFQVEAYFFDIRRQLFEYDQVLNTQRGKVYRERRRALESNDLQSQMLEYAERTIDDILEVGHRRRALAFSCASVEPRAHLCGRRCSIAGARQCMPRGKRRPLLQLIACLGEERANGQSCRAFPWIQTRSWYTDSMLCPSSRSSVQANVDPAVPMEEWPLEPLAAKMRQYCAAMADVSGAVLEAEAAAGGYEGLRAYLRRRGVEAYFAKVEAVEAVEAGLMQVRVPWGPRPHKVPGAFHPATRPLHRVHCRRSDACAAR